MRRAKVHHNILLWEKCLAKSTWRIKERIRQMDSDDGSDKMGKAIQNINRLQNPTDFKNFQIKSASGIRISHTENHNSRSSTSAYIHTHRPLWTISFYIFVFINLHTSQQIIILLRSKYGYKISICNTTQHIYIKKKLQTEEKRIKAISKERKKNQRKIGHQLVGFFFLSCGAQSNEYHTTICAPLHSSFFAHCGRSLSRHNNPLAGMDGTSSLLFILLVLLLFLLLILLLYLVPEHFGCVYGIHCFFYYSPKAPSASIQFIFWCVRMDWFRWIG